MNSKDSRVKITLVSAKDCDISYFKGSGNGGQNKQKTSSGCQIIHRESSAIGRCSETRSQFDNKKTAFIRLTETPKFKFWLNKKLYELQNQETIEETVEKMMRSDNLLVEVLKDGKWIKENVE